MGILPCKLGCPLISYKETVGRSVGSPLLPKSEISGQLSGQRNGLPIGILPCKLGCPLLPYMETVGSSVGSPLLPNMKYRRHSKECMWRQRGHFYMVFNVYDNEVTRVKEKHMSSYIEYESPLFYCRKVTCRVRVFSNVGQRSRNQN